MMNADHWNRTAGSQERWANGILMRVERLDPILNTIFRETLCVTISRYGQGRILLCSHRRIRAVGEGWQMGDA